MKKTATAQWQGKGKEGSGKFSAASRLFNNVPFTYATRFEQTEGTSPEELIAAAHASCFSMKLSIVLANTGFTTENLETACTITIEGGVITNSHLAVKAKVLGIDKAKFAECAEDARANCPVSKVLNAEVSMEAELV
ncbi:MAG TPA: OsmC family peroxiredoxin [Bacteroidia bacterium]|nr:OsmC family peroxiredoxin [Bacteroidia bacterium]